MSNLTTYGAGLAMAATAGSFFVGVGTGADAAGLIGEPSGNGYARVAVTITATGRLGTNAAQAQILATSAVFSGLTHAGLFTLASGGECVWVGPLNAASTLGPGQPITIAVGDLDVAIDVAA